MLTIYLAYNLYAKRIDRNVIQPDAKRATPARMYMYGVDFMPTSRNVLFGYHFKAIAAAGPIVGPITAANLWGVGALAGLADPRRQLHRLDRRDFVWINVTTNPTAEWMACQLTEAFPWNEATHYLIRDRDRIYGTVVTRRLRAMGIRDKPTAPASPWQNGFAERLIGSIRRECVDHIVVLGEAHLRRILRSYARYYNDIRTHRSLDKDAPVSRPVQRTGIISSRPILGGFITITCGFRFLAHTGSGPISNTGI